MQSFFIWNGVDCRSKGVFLRGPVPIIRPEERIEHVIIPGRAGELTLLEGIGIYNSYIQSPEIKIRGGFRVNEIENWLTGTKYITFSSQPNFRQKARLIGALTQEKHSRNMDLWEGTAQFYCEPLKELLTEESVTITASGATVVNRGDVPARPILSVTCTGDGSGGAADAVITIGGKTITVHDNHAGTILMIDCDAGIVYDQTATLNWTSWSEGPFPTLDVGENTISGSGWSSITIQRRERYL